MPKGSAASYNIRTWGYVPLDAAGHYRVLEVMLGFSTVLPSCVLSTAAITLRRDRHHARSARRILAVQATFTAPDGKDYTCGGKWLFKQRPLPPIILPLKQG